MNIPRLLDLPYLELPNRLCQKKWSWGKNSYDTYYTPSAMITMTLRQIFDPPNRDIECFEYDGVRVDSFESFAEFCQNNLMALEEFIIVSFKWDYDPFKKTKEYEAWNKLPLQERLKQINKIDHLQDRNLLTLWCKSIDFPTKEKE